MTEESICKGCEADGFCQIQDDKNDSQYDCLINSRWASVRSRLEESEQNYKNLLQIHDIQERSLTSQRDGFAAQNAELQLRLKAVKKLSPWFTIALPDVPKKEEDGAWRMDKIMAFIEEWEELNPIVRALLNNLHAAMEGPQP